MGGGWRDPPVRFRFPLMAARYYRSSPRTVANNCGHLGLGRVTSFDTPLLHRRHWDGWALVSAGWSPHFGGWSPAFGLLRWRQSQVLRLTPPGCRCLLARGFGGWSPAGGGPRPTEVIVSAWASVPTSSSPPRRHIDTAEKRAVKPDLCFSGQQYTGVSSSNHPGNRTIQPPPKWN